MEFCTSKSGKIVFARLSEGQDLLDSVVQVAENAKVAAGFFFLIGTLKRAKMGFFREGKYESIEMVQSLEIVSCMGNVAVKEGKTFAHAHIAVSDERGRVYGGHVMPGCLIGVTGELVLQEAAGAQLVRVFDEKTKLFLLSAGGLSARSRRSGSTG